MSRRILVTGATGYIGGRLVPILLETGYTVRVLVRDADRIARRPWASKVDVAIGDLHSPASLEGVCEGVDAAYYLVHSMYGGADYEQKDQEAALNFAATAKHVRHVVYLGGLLPKGRRVSSHLASRARVGELLRQHLPTTEFRAGPIIGSGSASFEMVRYLTERLPVMVAPKWILNPVQPIAVGDVLSYLVRALEMDPLGVVDIGADPLTFKQMMERFAEVRGLRRYIIPVPVLAPRLAALWIGLVTPIPNSLAVPLVEGVVAPVLADTRKAKELFPDIDPIAYRDAVRRALSMTEQNQVETRWSGALGATEDTDADSSQARRAVPSKALPRDTHERSDREGLISEVHSVYVPVPPQSVFLSFSSLGGRRGWLVWNWAWALRGLMDKCVGGPGLRRGRRHPVELYAGEALDFWRVESVDPSRLLRLRAEMKVPGRAWLQWEAVPEGTGTRLVQTALFAPKGLAGALYWYSLYPIHMMIFRDMVRAIAHDALQPAPGTSL